MAPTTPDARLYSLDLAKIAADLHRVDHRVDDLLAIGQRLSRLGADITSACERSFVAAQDDAAA
ncbi:MAG: hypothetical protein NVS3B17_07760 [Vulcanimicrobiaceae bacterium]